MNDKQTVVALNLWVLVCLLLVPGVCLADHYDVYLMAGQSNMDGRGAISELSENERKPFDNAIIYYRNMPTSSDGWQPLAPGFSMPPKHKDGLPSPTFGPELGFAAAVLEANPDRKLALIKGSKGGSSLRVDWNPGDRGDAKTQGIRYLDFIETIQLATKKLTQRGDTYTIQGLLWHQGESDSTSKSKVYQERLEKFITRIREDLDVLSLPVVVGEVYDNGKRDNVRAAIGAVGKSGTGIGLVSCKDLTTWDKGTHFDAASQLMLGKRYAQATLALQSKVEAASLLSNSIADETWVVDSQADWQQNVAEKSNLEIKKGFVSPTNVSAKLQSKLKTFKEKRSAKSIVFDQSPVWQNWESVANIGPENLGDAPVMLSIGPDNYWMFGRYRAPRPKQGEKPKKLPAFEPKEATLEGFDVPLKTTRFANQYNAPGGLKKGRGGYHAWQSRDMVNWVHHGPITEGFAKWMTTAEYADGKAYFYYDFPNDQDPHVYVDEDLFDGVPGKNMGIALKDPSHGSDCGTIRDLDGNFHIIFENWDPIHAASRSWDSPLAGHAVSPDGVNDFKFLAPAVDERTKPTGETKTYKHPHWVKEDPKNFKTNIAEYKVHTPNQEAFGDWAAICIGGQYYLFGDYDPEHKKPMSVAWFTSSSLHKQFEFCDNVGKGHPDPDICFAEGRFYLATQQKNDFTSPGPWVEQVDARVGVDTDNDGAIDQWTDWQQVKETYDFVPGFAKQIKKTPASIDLSKLPAGFGFQFEIKMKDTTENKSKPILDKVTLQIDDATVSPKKRSSN